MKDNKLLDIFKQQGLLTNDVLETLKDVFELVWDLLKKQDKLEVMLEWMISLIILKKSIMFHWKNGKIFMKIFFQLKLMSL